MNETKSYIRQSDIEEYKQFCYQHIPRFGRQLPDTLWHYTSAEGLIGILKTGKIWTTQISCLNDRLEQKHFGDLVHAAVRSLRLTNQDPKIDVLLRIADIGLGTREFAAVSNFVACLSEKEDDLGQWRGYGGGQCGYAIGFASKDVLAAVNRRKGLLAPMNYDPNLHTALVGETVRAAQKFFLDGLERPDVTDTEKWAADFLYGFGNELDVFASTIKHPKFASEEERRIITWLRPDEFPLLEFRQKQTLLARHLPIDMTIDSRLPITAIYVGPGPAQQVSRVSVNALLRKYEYENTPVNLSQVPYRVP